MSKFFEVNLKVSEKMQGEAAQKGGSGAAGGAGGGVPRAEWLVLLPLLPASSRKERRSSVAADVRRR